MDTKPSLNKLLAALALGARSVNSLPINNNSDDDDDDDMNDEDNEFAFLSSLPEFATLNSEAQSSLSTLLCEALTIVPSDDNNGGGDDNDTVEYEFDDPELWERCADACDALYDRVNDYITAEQRRRGGIGEEEGDNVLSAINGLFSHFFICLRKQNAKG